MIRISALAVALLIGSLSLPAAAQEVTLRVHHFLPATSLTHAGLLEPWAERITEASNGRIAFEIYPAMALGGRAPQLYDQVKDGVVDIVWTLPGYSAGRFPLSSVFELPFLVSDAEATSQAIEDFAGTYLREEFSDIHPLLFHVHGRGSFHMNGLAIESMEDLSGITIRAPNKVIGDVLAALGANPVFMPVPQVPESLSRGVIQGAVLPFEVTLPLKVHELTTDHTRVPGPRGLYTAVFLLAMNKDRFDGLAPDLQAVIEAESSLELARNIGAAWDAAEIPGMAAAQDHGNAFHELSAEEVARWQGASQGVINAWVAERNAEGHDGQALLDEARRLVALYTGDAPN